VAWEFQAGLPLEERFEVVTICPGLVMGPSLIPGGFASGEIIGYLLNGFIGKNAGDTWPLVDVREVAQAHLHALLVPEARNQRFLLVNCALWGNEMAAPLY